METFVVRLWVPGSGPGSDGADGSGVARSGPDEVGTVDLRVRGIVEHVASGRQTLFGSAEELGAFLVAAAHSTRSQPEGLPGG